MRFEKFFEFKNEEDIQPIIKSFYLKDELNPKTWDDFELKSDIREQLLKIGEDFFTTFFIFVLVFLFYIILLFRTTLPYIFDSF